MYNIKLDENNYYTGSYAKVGKIQGGIDVPSLPPTESVLESSCYQWVQVMESITDMVPQYDEETGTVLLDEEGNTIHIEQTSQVSVMKWVLDETKLAALTVSALEVSIETKIKEIGEICKQVIYNGTDVILSDGISYHFSLTSDDQANIDGLYSKALLGAEMLPYHADKSFCKLYPAADIIAIGNAAVAFKTYNTTLCNYLNTYLRSLTSEAEVNAVTYSLESLPTNLQEDFLSLIASIQI